MRGTGASLATAIRGPVVLIALGALFLVDHFGPYRFSQTWPVLIIIYGVLKLLEKTSQSKSRGGPGFPEGFLK